MLRRTVLGGLAAVPAGLLVGTPRAASASGGDTLRYGSATSVGLLADHVDALTAIVEAGLAPSPTYPLYPGAVLLAARRGVVVSHFAKGNALRYASSAGAELPAAEQLAMRRDTIFDVASLSKLFTAVVAMQQVERDRISLDAPVASYVPAFAANGKAGVTVRQLMTHTAGLPAGLGLDPYPTIPERLAAIYAVALRTAPGTAYLYSDLSFIMVGKIVEAVTGEPLDVVVRKGILTPLRLRSTLHNPPASLRPRIAATEWQESGRGLVWGSVHDRTSWLLGGIAGHAGVFSTAYDIAVFGQLMLNGGSYGGVCLLRPSSVAAMLTNHNAFLGPGAERGLGFQLAAYSYMGAMTTPSTFGHTGFTGTSLVVEPSSQTLLVLMSNKVHPTRAWSDLAAVRRAVASTFARSVPVRPASGRTAWFSGMGDSRTALLTLPMPRHGGSARLSFSRWFDTEPGADALTLEASGDGGVSWAPLDVVSGYSGRRWHPVSVTVPSGTTHVRWRYATDGQYHGRGMYVDGVTIREGGRTLFDGRRPTDAARFALDGFVTSRD